MSVVSFCTVRPTRLRSILVLKPNAHLRIVVDPGYHTLGYPPPPNAWNPLFDTSLSPEEAIRKMSVWGSSYFTHGEGRSPEQLEIHTPVQDPPPTIAILTEVELAWMHISEPDTLLVHHGIRLGVFDQLRKDALFLGDKAGLEGDEWSTIEVRHVLCDRSQWETTWGMWELQSEVEEGRRAGKRMRNVTFLRLRGVNHFVSALSEHPCRIRPSHAIHFISGCRAHGSSQNARCKLSWPQPRSRSSEVSYWWPASVPHSTLPVELCEMHVDNVVRTPPTQCNESDLSCSVSGLYDAFRELCELS